MVGDLVRLPSNLRQQGTVAQGAPARALDDLREFECQSSRGGVSSNLLADPQTVSADPGMDSNHELDRFLDSVTY